MVAQRGSIAARQMTGRRDLPPIAAAAARIKAKSYTIDGEAVVAAA